MADLIIATSTAPSTPSSGFADNYVDSTTKMWRTKNDAGNIRVYPHMLTNASAVGASAAFAADTYLSGSNIVIPVAGDWLVNMTYYCQFDMTKTANGTATFIITIRMGTAGTTSDTAIQTITFAAGTAAIDEGIFEVYATFKSVGSGTSAVLVSSAKCSHHLAATGLVSTGASGTGIIKNTSSGFNSTTPTTIGLSINGGASFSGTNVQVQSQLSI